MSVFNTLMRRRAPMHCSVYAFCTGIVNNMHPLGIVESIPWCSLSSALRYDVQHRVVEDLPRLIGLTISVKERR